MAELYVNDPGTFLASGCTNSATTISVVSSAGYPGSGNFRIKIDTEIMLVTGVSGTTWTVTRGAESTTAIAHLGGTAVNHVLTAGALTSILSGVGGGGASRGTYSSIPGSPSSGTTYFTTDGFSQYVESGGSWYPYGPIHKFGNVPTFGTWLNQGSATYSAATGSGILVAPGNAGDSLRCVYTAAPSTPWTITAYIVVDTYTANYSNAGIMLYDSVSGRITTYNIGWVNQHSISVVNWSSATGYNSTPSGNFVPPWGDFFIRIVNNGTNLTFSTSKNGYNFTANEFYTVGHTSWLTNGTSHFGLMADSNNSKPVVLTCHSFVVT